MNWSRLEINLDALAHNFREIKGFLGEDTQVMCVVKSDAYGHGMLRCAQCLADEGVNFFAVSKLDEALELRSQGFSQHILVLSGIDADEIDQALKNNIIISLYREDLAFAFSEKAISSGRKAKVHVKIDTGMNRLGVPHEKAQDFLLKIKDLHGLEISGLFSHFAVADEEDPTFTRKQLNRFLQVVTFARGINLSITHLHIANSAGSISFPEAHLNLVRPGVALYGGYPSSRFFPPLNLQPVMTFKTKIIQIKRIPAGVSIGYGRMFFTRKESTIATIPIGYDDGYNRLLSSKGKVLVRGKRVSVVGRVSMNLITLDVSEVPGVQEGDDVVLLGCQGKERITAEELAEQCNTINYEIFCRFGSLRPKVFVSSKNP